MCSGCGRRYDDRTLISGVLENSEIQMSVLRRRYCDECVENSSSFVNESNESGFLLSFYLGAII